MAFSAAGPGFHGRGHSHLAVSFILVVVLAAAPARALPPSSNNGQALTSTNGPGTGGTSGITAMPDLFTGSMSHEVAIELPPGRRGMAPELALRYRSGNANGWLGVGWEMEFGSVERNPKNGVDFGADDFILRTSGSSEELVFVGTCGAGCREYRARIEGQFRRVRSFAAADGRTYWEVTDRLGTRSLFGQTAASRMDNSVNASQILRWCLDRTVDTSGNEVLYTYAKAQGDIYPATASYNGNTIRFWLDGATRPDVATMYGSGFSVTTQYLLKTIDVRAQGKLQRAYRLSYSPSASTGRSLLAKVEQFGVDVVIDAIGNVVSGTQLPATTFSYTAGLSAKDTRIVGPARSLPGDFAGMWGAISRLLYGDFNGDGRLDMVAVEGWGGTYPWSIHLANGSGFDAPIAGPPMSIPGDHDGIATLMSRFRLGDFNGDGKTDVLVIEGWNSTAASSIYYSNGTSFSRVNGPAFSVPGDHVGVRGLTSRFLVGDFNGDGKADFLVVGGWGGTYPWSIYLADGNGFYGPYAGPSMSIPGDHDGIATLMSRFRLGDFNGDGKTDVLVINGWGQYTPMTIWFSTSPSSPGAGVSFQAASGPSRFVRPDHAMARADLAQVLVGDFNGDGKTDLLAVEEVFFGTANANVYLANGIGFDAAKVGPSFWRPTDTDGQVTLLARFRVADFDGDGRSDIGVIEGGGGSTSRMSLYLARGNGFAGRIDGPNRWVGTYHDGARIDMARVSTGDFDGDGRADVMALEGWNTPSAAMSVTIATDTSWRFASPPDLLSGVANGIGATATIAYTPSTRHPNSRIPFPVQTVTAVTLSDGNGNSSTTSFSYSGGYFHIGTRDYRGFNDVQVSPPLGPNGEGTRTQTLFHQGNDLGSTNVPDVTEAYMKGKPYWTKVWDVRAAERWTETSTTYAPGSLGAPFFNPPQQVVETKFFYYYDESEGSYELGSWPLKTTYGYDSYGNVTREDRYGDTYATHDDTTIVRTLSPNPTAWIVGLPASETVYQGAGAATPLEANKIAATWFYFDGTTNPASCAPTGFSATPTRGNLTKVVRWLNGGTNPESWTGYDSYGNVTCTSDPDRRLTKYGYDASGTFRTSATNALNHAPTLNTYYGVGGHATYGDTGCSLASANCGLYGQPKSTTDANNATTATQYDLLGRKRLVTRPDASQEVTYYYLGGVGTNRVESHSSWGAWAAAYFDGLGRTYLSKRKGSATGRTFASQVKYNASGTKLQESLPYQDGVGTPRWTTFAYDGFGRATTTTRPDGTTTLACYTDGASVVVDANKHRRREVSDRRGLRVYVQEYTGQHQSCSTDEAVPFATTSYQHDRLGRLTRVTNAAGTPFIIDYDTLGRKIASSDPDLGNWSYGYTAAGDLWWQQDAKGNRTYFEYDALHRVKLKDYPSGADISYVYDEPSVPYAIGRLTKIKDPTRSDALPADGTLAYDYDVMGRVTRSAQVTNGIWYTTRAAYDTAGRLSVTTYPDGAVVANRYDADGALCKVTSSAADQGCIKSTDPTVTTYALLSDYNELGQLQTLAFGNGVTTKYGYYDHTNGNRLNTIDTLKPGASLTWPFPVQNLLLSLRHTYDAVGNVKYIGDNLSNTYSQSFWYDELDRLTSAYAPALPYGSLSYSYDRIGNILTKEGISYTKYDPFKVHAVKETSDGKTFSYDANGNMYLETGSTARTLTYDFDNRPTAITNGGVTTSFAYDFAGGRMRKQSPSATTVYVGKLYECTGSTCTKHIFAGTQRVASVVSTGTKRYYHADHLGSTRVVTDQTAAVIETILYRPFGAAQQDTVPANSKHKFTGQEFDPETGLYFYNARYYNPVLGRFLSADSMAEPRDPQMLNRYSYVRNSPISLNDPTGHWPNWGKLWGWMTQPAVALPLQFLLPPVGTAALLSTKGGRNILAGELVATTAVATFYCGGCATLGTGALLGEITGGASAWARGGDILAGAAVGGAVGFATAGMSGPITGSLGRQMALGGLRGALQGSAFGAVGGWAGGKGDMSDIRRGALIGGITGGIVGTLTPAVLGRNMAGDPGVRLRLNQIEEAARAQGLSLDTSKLTIRGGGLPHALFNESHWGFTLGDDVFYMNPAQTSTGWARTLAHEVHHALSWQHYGWQYSVSYLFNSNFWETAASDFSWQAYP